MAKRRRPYGAPLPPIPVSPNPSAGIGEDIINRGLGRTPAAGVPSPRPPSGRNYVPVPSGAVTGRISTGGISLPTEVQDNYERAFGEGSVGGGENPFDFLTRALRNIDRDTQARQQGINQAAQTLPESQRVISAVGHVPGGWESALTSFAKSPPGRFLDIIQRPDYAVAEGLREVAEQSKTQAPPSGPNDRYTIEDVNKQLDEETKGKAWYEPNADVKAFGTGFWRGLSGQAKTGMGDVVEEAHPDLPLTTKRILGITGDVFAPSSFYGGAGVKALRGSGKAVTLENLTEAAGDISRGTVRKAISSGTVAAPRGARNMPGGGFAPAAQVVEQEIFDAVTEIFRTSSMQFRRGGLANRVIGSGKRNTAVSAATRGAEIWVEGKLATFHRYVDQYRAAINSGAPIGSRRLDVMKRQEPLFREFLDAIPPGTRQITDRVMDTAADTVRRQFQGEAIDLTRRLTDDLIDIYYTAPGIRVGSKTLHFKRVGRAFSAGGRGINRAASRFGINLGANARALSYGAKFPGRLSLLSQKVKALGVQRYLEFERAVKAASRGINKADRKRITYAIENHVTLTDPRLQQAKEWIQDQYARMYQDEIAAGVRRSFIDSNTDLPRIDPNTGLRMATTPEAEDYTFVWTRRGRSQQRDFKNRRKKSIRNSGGNTAGFRTSDAKAAGLRPVEDAFEALLMRKLKSNRDMSRGWFKNDLLNHYGKMGKKVSENVRYQRNLVQMKTADLAEPFVQAMGRQDKWYLPTEIKQVLDEFDKLSKFDSEGWFLRIPRKVLSKYKAFRTVYLPGYHVRNMLSDMFMGFIDGVSVRTYGEVLRKVHLSRLRDPNTGRLIERVPHFHPNPNSTFKIGPNRTLQGDELWDLYRQNASSGYVVVGSEFGPARAAPGRAVRRVSEGREDFGRVVHFLHALREEYRGVTARNANEAWNKAIEQAVYRVNHYKFDYGALTKWEQKYMKLVVPFYTFTRKAVPTMIESLMLNPRWMVRANKVMQARGGEGFEDFNPATVAPWMRDVGFALTGDEKQPYAVTQDILPTNVLQNVVPYPGGWSNIARKYGSQLNPVAQAFIEIMSEKDIFLGKEVNPGANYFGSEIGPWKEAMDMLESRRRGESWKEIALKNRLFGAGLSTRRITSGQQQIRMKQWEDMLIDGPFKAFNDTQGEEKGISIYVSRAKEGSSYRVKDVKSEKILFQSTNPFEALDFAEKGSSQAAIPLTLDEFNARVEDQGIRIYYSQRKDGNSYRVKNTRTDEILYDSKSIEKAYEWANKRTKYRSTVEPAEDADDMETLFPSGGGGTDSRMLGPGNPGPAGMARSIMNIPGVEPPSPGPSGFVGPNPNPAQTPWILGGVRPPLKNVPREKQKNRVTYARQSETPEWELPILEQMRQGIIPWDKSIFKGRINSRSGTW